MNHSLAPISILAPITFSCLRATSASLSAAEPLSPVVQDVSAPLLNSVNSLRVVVETALLLMMAFKNLLNTNLISDVIE